MFDMADKGQSIAGAVDPTIGGASLLVDKQRAQLAMGITRAMAEMVVAVHGGEDAFDASDQHFLDEIRKGSSLANRGRPLGSLQAARGVWMDLRHQTATDYIEGDWEGLASGGSRAVDSFGLGGEAA